MFTLIYTLHIAVILSFSLLNHQTYAMELVELDNNRDLQTYTIQSNDPRLAQKATLKFVNNGNLTKQYNRAVLEISTHFKNTFTDIGFSQDAIPVTCQSEDFDAVYQGMEELIKDNNDRIKQFNLNALYTPKKSPELIAALSIANELDISPLTKILACRVAQQCDITIHDNKSADVQNKYLKNYLASLEEPNLIQIILSNTTARIPTFKKLSKDEYESILGDEYKDILDKGILSPLKRVKLTKNGTLALCSSHQTTDQRDEQPSSLEETKLQYYSMFENQDFFTNNCIFSPAENHMFYITGGNNITKNNAVFVNINNPQNTFEIKNIIWSEKNNFENSFRKFSCFNDNGTRLLIRTFDDLQDGQYTYERYEVIDTSTRQPVKTIESDGINNISFCAADKLCVQYTEDKDDTTTHSYPLSIMNNDNEDSYKEFDHVTAHAFNGTKDTLVMCTHSLKETTVTIFDMTKNSIIKTLTLDTLLNDISIVFNKNNNDFLIYGKNVRSATRIFLCNPTNAKPTNLINWTNAENPELNWSASGDYIIYKDHRGNEITTGYFSIAQPSSTKVEFTPNTTIDSNPHQDIVYLSDKETLQIYDLTTNAVVKEYATKDCFPSRTLCKQTTDLLNPNGQLLIIPTKEKWIVINTKTGVTVADNGWTMTNHRLSWYNDCLLVEKCDNTHTWRGIQNSFFAKVPSGEYKFDVLFKPTYDNFENKKISSSNTTSATIASTHYTKYYIGGALAFASFIAVYIYYPELLKKLGFGH